MAAEVMRPRVIRRDKKLHLSYQLPTRIHRSAIYPIDAPNSSTLLLYAHDRGLRVLWRGGRRRRQQQQQHSSNRLTYDLISDELSQDEFETNEEELDSDCPYPAIIADLDIDFSTDGAPVAALHIAVPSLNPAAPIPDALESTAIVAVASDDGAVRLLRIPMSPPKEDDSRRSIHDLGQYIVQLVAAGPLPADISLKYIAADYQRPASLGMERENAHGHFLVASASHTLKVWAVTISAEAESTLMHSIPLPYAASRVAFHGSPRNAHMLVGDSSGTVRIFDPRSVNLPRRRSSSSDSMLIAPVASGTSGTWIMTYHTSYASSKDVTEAEQIFARRRKVLDAKWALGGRGILALLDDGEWGIWDVSSPPAGKRVEQFAIRGFLGTAGVSDVVEPISQRKGTSKLAPMTPNTLKMKAQQLFTGAPKVPGAAPSGGISIAASSPRTGHADESVVVWYGGDVYSITSLAQFWQRSTSTSGGLGSLYSPGLTHFNDINLMNENVTSVDQFTNGNTASRLGQMNLQRDLLLTTEHRMVVLQSVRPAVPSRQLIQLAELPVSSDQHVLESGRMDLDGVDRMLDSMTAGSTTGRKVGFAES